jgi:hypothetical protein
MGMGEVMRLLGLGGSCWLLGSLFVVEFVPSHGSGSGLSLPRSFSFGALSFVLQLPRQPARTSTRYTCR